VKFTFFTFISIVRQLEEVIQPYSMMFKLGEEAEEEE
jgi:hypothetical protein